MVVATILKNAKPGWNKLFTSPGLFKLLFAVVAGSLALSEADQCSLSEARQCLEVRHTNYDKEQAAYTQTGDVTTSLQTLCQTQVTDDAQGQCFKQYSTPCSRDDASDVRTQWADLNTNIVQLCNQVCPTFQEVAGCKNLTDATLLAGGKAYEAFCNSFNQSLACAKSSLEGCQFGLDLLYAVQGRLAISSWTQICQSGCRNIDESIRVFAQCANHIKETEDMVEFCRNHDTFKKCIFTSDVACAEVLTLVKFKFRAYDRFNQICATTTTSTTTTTTSTTTTSLPTSTDTTAARETTPETKVLNVSMCLAGTDVARMSNYRTLNKDQVIEVLKVEVCLHEMGGDLDSMHEAVKTLPVDFQKTLVTARREGYRHLQEAGSQGDCPEAAGSRSGGCSGHEYGLIPCRSCGFRGLAVMSLVYMMTFATLDLL